MVNRVLACSVDGIVRELARRATRMDWPTRIRMLRQWRYGPRADLSHRLPALDPFRSPLRA